MVYRAIGVMSGSSLDGMDIVFTEMEERAGNWSFEILACDCIAYNEKWFNRLQKATSLNAYEYMLLHSEFGKLTGENINAFINKNDLHHKVQLIASHGHTVFHAPQSGMTAQLGNGAAIAAATGVNVVTDLRAMDVALGGQGAPIVPMGEKLLLPGYAYYLNLGGIANISAFANGNYVAFDVCPANRVLNLLAAKEGKAYDDEGAMAQSGTVNTNLLILLNSQAYYRQSYPKSLANDFGTHVLFPLIESFKLPAGDVLRTYAEHIAQQVAYAINNIKTETQQQQMLVTGGGAFNKFLVKRLQQHLDVFNIEIVLPNNDLVNYKEALIMALLGVLRWREEDTVLQSVTGAIRSSIGGAVWIGQEA